MCDRSELVPIPDLLWQHNAIYDFQPDHGEYGINDVGERCLALDACIVPAVKALWAAGIVTLSCCCGHGDPWGVVTIQTQSGVGQRGAMVLRAERYDELVRAEQERDALGPALEKLADVAQFVLDRITSGATNEERYAMKDAARIAMDAYRALGAHERRES